MDVEEVTGSYIVILDSHLYIRQFLRVFYTLGIA